MEAKMVLRDSESFPSVTVLQQALGDTVYRVLESFFETVTNEEYGLATGWRYYKDGKAWLCKIVYRKKTILWLSVWDGFFKVSFYFTEKHLENIAALDISGTIKEDFKKAIPAGRLIPMIIDVTRKEQLEDLLAVIRLKKSLK